MRELKQDWRDVFKGFRLALDPKKMLLGMIWAFLCILIVMLTLTFFARPDSALSRGVGDLVRNPGGQAVQMLRGACARMAGEARPDYGSFVSDVRQWAAGAHEWGRGAWAKVIVSAVVWTLFALLFWAWFAAPLLRLCALQFTRDESISFNEACAFSAGKRKSFFFAPLVPSSLPSSCSCPS